MFDGSWSLCGFLVRGHAEAVGGKQRSHLVIVPGIKSCAVILGQAADRGLNIKKRVRSGKTTRGPVHRNCLLRNGYWERPLISAGDERREQDSIPNRAFGVSQVFHRANHCKKRRQVRKSQSGSAPALRWLSSLRGILLCISSSSIWDVSRMRRT